MKRVNIKKMLEQTHPDDEISTEVTEQMIMKDEDMINRIKESGLQKIRFSEAGAGIESRYVRADIIEPKKKRKIIPVAAAACITFAAVAVPAVLSINSGKNIPYAGKDITDNIYSDIAVTDADIPENINTEVSVSAAPPGCIVNELKEVKTYPEYEDIHGVHLADGKIYVFGSPERRNVCLLYYTDPETQKKQYTEFLSVSDIPDQFKNSNGYCPLAEIHDFYISDDGYLYYFGSVREWNDDRKLYGIAGKYNLMTCNNEKIKFYNEISFENILGFDDEKFLLESVSGDNTACCYNLDTGFEALIRNDVHPETPDFAECVSTDAAHSFIIQKAHNFNDTDYMIVNLTKSHCSKISQTDLSSGDTESYYIIDGGTAKITESGKVFSVYWFQEPDDPGFAYSSLAVYNDGLPELLSGKYAGNLALCSCDDNIVIDYFDFEKEKTIYSVFTQVGEKLYDFELPDDNSIYIGNKTYDSGEKIYYLAGDEKRIVCYEPETDTRTEPVKINEIFSYQDNMNISMTSSGEYDFTVNDGESIYGYKTDTDEIVLITDQLKNYGVNFQGFCVSDDGTVFCTVEGSNTLYSFDSNLSEN